MQYYIAVNNLVDILSVFVVDDATGHGAADKANIAIARGLSSVFLPIRSQFIRSSCFTSRDGAIQVVPSSAGPGTGQDSLRLAAFRTNDFRQRNATPRHVAPTMGAIREESEVGASATSCTTLQTQRKRQAFGEKTVCGSKSR